MRWGGLHAVWVKLLSLGAFVTMLLMAAGAADRWG